MTDKTAFRIISINLQHYLWGKLFGYLTHPDIPTRDPHLRVADVGTGIGLVLILGLTGSFSQLGSIWLTDLGDRLPKSVRLDGLDVSFHATPPPQWLPPNMTLRHWDVKADIPEDFVALYDIVHIRNFAFVLHSDDIQCVLDNLTRLIRTFVLASLHICTLLGTLKMVFLIGPGATSKGRNLTSPHSASRRRSQKTRLRHCVNS